MGPRIIAVAGNRGHLWGEQHRIETRTKRNHSRVNSGRLTIGGNYSRSPEVCCQGGRHGLRPRSIHRRLQNHARARWRPGRPRGLKVLYEDPKLGFQVLPHINDRARTSPPHDHGASGAIYGQATKYPDMTEWQREDNGADPKLAKLKPAKKYRLTPGKAGIYQDGAIHSIDYPDYARFIRVTGTNLDKINRIKIDLKSGEVEQMYAQQAS